MAVLAGIMLFLSCSFPALAAKDVVAKVGGIAVSSYELNREIQKIMPMNASFHGGISKEKIEEIRQKALDILIERTYKVRYALAEEIAADNKIIDEKFKKIRERYKKNAEFKKALGGETPEALRTSMYRELLAEKAEQVAVGDKVKVSAEQVRAFYDKNKETYMRPKQFKASHILVKVDPSSNAQEKAVFKKKAEDLAVKARAGEDFYDLAYYNSDDRSRYVGGDIGYFHEGQTVPEFETELKKMKPGETSNPVQTRFGYHIIKLVEVNEARQLTFEEVGDKIRESLKKRQRDALYEEWMTGLKKQFVVERL
jgi:parvulin-like peptidyl-prolyl isomerase